MRSESILPKDQPGFIKNSHSFLNIRRLFNIKYAPPSPICSEAVVSLDAEKAFNRVDWEYLFYTLRKFWFCEKIISQVRLLYSLPLASVRTNNINSEYFSLQRGTRQGCLLSPLLFAITIEPLSISSRSHPQILGILRGEAEQNVVLNGPHFLSKALYSVD